VGYSVQRRFGTRIRAQIPLRLTSVDPAVSFSENCHTLLINPGGCGLRFPRSLKPGLRVRVDGLPDGTSAIARVACSLPPASGSKYWVVGIGLDSPGNPWYLAPAPTDWGTYALAAGFPSASFIRS
jgi:hypothetical protein